MAKTQIFTAKNVECYGLTGREIDALNAEWQSRASELGLEEHVPEYWQQARRHMEAKLAGFSPAKPEELGPGSELDGEPLALPSLDVNLDDFDIAGHAETGAGDAPEELPELEPLFLDELELDDFSEEQVSSVEEGPVEVPAVEEKTAEKDGEAAVSQLEMEETAEEQAMFPEERVDEKDVEEETASIETSDLQTVASAPPVDPAAQESEEEFPAGKKTVLVEEHAEKSFFARIIARLRKLF